MSTFAGKVKSWASDVFPALLIFVALDLVLTLIFFGTTGSSVHIGTLRPLDTIPSKLLELAAVGLGVGLVASLASRAVDFSLITLGVGFTMLLDLDHLPAAFGVAQPIRPAHSLAFLAFVVCVLYFAIRNRPEIEAILVAAFLGHMAADTGIFAFFAPFSFTYSSLDAFRIPFAVGSIAFALLAGYLKLRGRRKENQRSLAKDSVMIKG